MRSPIEGRNPGSTGVPELMIQGTVTDVGRLRRTITIKSDDGPIVTVKAGEGQQQNSYSQGENIKSKP